MAEEKKAYKKAKEKSSLDKRKHDPDWKVGSVFCLSVFLNDKLNLNCEGDSAFRVSSANIFR